MARPAFEVVEDTPDEQPPQQSRLESAGLSTLLLGLKTLSQRTLVALDNLFTLITVGSAFWLWMSIPSPNTYQLIGLAMYGTFVLAANWIVRTK